MKNFSAIAFAFVALTAAFNASAKDVTASIVNVSPVYSDRIQQQQVCDVIQSDQPQLASPVNAGSVIGGIAGALLGGQVGNGNGRIAMAALGAVTGAISGDRLVQRNTQPQQVCRWVQRVDQQVSNYRVTYEYQGDMYQAVLPYDPSRNGSVSTVTVQMNLSMR